MRKALYGRMRLDRCVKVDMGHIGCQKLVLDIADSKCSGRRSCEIAVPDNDFESTKPCLELMSYLEASYECHKVATVESSDCRNSRFLRTTQQSGSIASVTLQETWCGTKDSPWLIQGSKGQQINLTLVDFSAPRMENQNRPNKIVHARITTTTTTKQNHGCDEYATIVEQSESNKNNVVLTVCGKNSRHQILYLSKGHVVQVQLESRSSSEHFLINYEIVGCTDPVLTGGMWFKRESTAKAFVGCKNSNQKSKITCLQGVWDGELSNCSEASYLEISGISNYEDTQSPGNKILIAVVILIVVLASFLFLLIVFFYRRYNRNRHHHHHHHQCDYPTPISMKSKSSLYGAEDEMDHHHPPPHHHHHEHRHRQTSYMSSGNRSLRYGHHHHHHQQQQQPQYEKHRKCDSPVSRSGCSDYSVTNYEQMDEDVESLPIPLPQKTKNPAKTAAVTLGSLTGEKFTHIWEMPLPTPGE